MLPEHPSRIAAREQLRLPQNEPVIALLPGSRQSEVHYMAKLFVQTARVIAAVTPQVHFLVPLLSRETRDIFETELYRSGGGDLPLTILFGHSHVAMTAADAVLVASGTATLEAALLKCPMVITYKLSPLTWRMMQRKRYQPYVGLPNILAGRFIVPELLQDDATPENLAQAVLNLVNDGPVKGKLTRAFSKLHLDLKQNAAERAVDAILPFLS
jgi:lipid-A-disaccharide synthase